MGAGGGGPAESGAPCWPCQGAVVLVESGAPCWPRQGAVLLPSLAPPAGPDREHWTCQGAVVLVKSGTPCWPRQGTVVLAGGSGPAESGALAGPVPSVQELSAGMHLRFLLHPKEPPCWVPGLCSQPPNPLLGQQVTNMHDKQG